ncbi:ATP-binding protein [Fusobacterium polymorphum]
MEYIKNLMHPLFIYKNNSGFNIEVSPAILVSSNELAIHMGLPRNSVPGFPVVEHIDFGKEIVKYDSNDESKKISLGNIFNMGKVIEENKVELDLESLSMHTFISGATGSGKSNTIYHLLNKLIIEDIKFMVIEPAKGEYKKVLGHRKDVRVFGTNPNLTELLHINPFRFPKEIHVLEHIDRLIEIFNVCWPMYAAMPAILKEAIIQAYRKCGWDLDLSINFKNDNFFPTFIDLLEELKNVIKLSEYSEEVKSNYIGSLTTRVKSLTNGLNGQIFSSNEINNEILFDTNVIVDLSRVGSQETKSLLMGVLVMRLSEHRMATSKTSNRKLHHVTVLEEAHNILRAKNSASSVEGSNVAEKAVEMISNAIAEMRTYGEGFIIVDQSPSAVDISAIRNTNTKIIMRLPEENDRKIAGKSAALKEEQINEIARLPKGVAVVYQNDWIEAVLCQINKFDGEEKDYHYRDKEIYNEKKK